MEIYYRFTKSLSKDDARRSCGYRLAMPKKKLNAEGKREREAGAISLFVLQYGRKAQKGVEPNDRSYNRKLERN